MGWSFRKSFRLAKGVRMTLSKSGVSYSMGGRGYRLTAGPRGTYVTLGAAGIRYRQRLDLPHEAQPTPSPVPLPDIAGTVIETAPVEQLVDATSASTIEEINRCLARPQF